jgi:hypothetical protein
MRHMPEFNFRGQIMVKLHRSAAKTGTLESGPRTS